jgi:hypothetical protein
MSVENKKTVKHVIRKFINQETTLIEELSAKPEYRLEWGFIVSHPKSKDDKKNPVFQINKSSLGNFLTIATKIIFLPEDIKKIKNTPNEAVINNLIRRLLLSQVINHTIHSENLTVDLSLRVYLNDIKSIEENLFNSLRRIYFAGLLVFDTFMMVSGIKIPLNGGNRFSPQFYS